MIECGKCGNRYPTARVVFPIHCRCGEKIGTPPPRGIGDVVERGIKWLTRGRIKPCGGCRRRRDRLNQLWPFSGGDDAGGTEPRR